jgi:hypothetical protein
MNKRLSTIWLALLALACGPTAQAASYDDLVALFHEWRKFESPPMREGAPDYTASTMASAHQRLKTYQARLLAMRIDDWPVEQQVDWHLVRAEMNGMDFNIRVLRPWARDPAFYATVWTEQSDTPAHEGPTHHHLLELWTYSFPLSSDEQARLAGELSLISPLLKQARDNLTGDARDLWVAGIKNIRDQAAALRELEGELPQENAELAAALAGALTSTEEFAGWLEQQAPSRNGPSGIGKDNYTWYLRNVHLVPLSWEEERTVLQRELDRAHASLKLEEQRNRDLPPLQSIESEAEYDRRAHDSVSRYMAFLDQQRILPVKEYMDPAVRRRIGHFVPAESRNFFWTAVHYEPMTLWTHFYHWFDLAQMEYEPHASPIRRGPLLYNIFDSRAEGMATGMEEMMMHAGLYDDNPHAREIVWIMLAQRAARGLASLYAHANEFTMQQAQDFQVDWTPRGWMRKDLELLAFEQHLYLRQPGYGTSYVTGKVMLEALLARRARQQGGGYSLYDFFAEVNAAGVIPVSLIQWQLTGEDRQIRDIVGSQR